jgi:hypothetical protein
MERGAPAGHMMSAEGEPCSSEAKLLGENDVALENANACKQNHQDAASSTMNVQQSTCAHKGTESRKGVGDLHERVLRLAQQCNYDTSRQVLDLSRAPRMLIRSLTNDGNISQQGPF